MAEPRISLVVAAARNGVIGTRNSLPWSLPSDMKRFKELTIGHPVIMGRHTYESIGRPLADRDNIVLSSGGYIDHPQVYTVNSIEEAIALAKRFAVSRGVDEIMVIGGGQVYAKTLPMAHRIYFTEVDLDVDGDTEFPEFDRAKWRETSREDHKAGPNDAADFSILTLERAA